MNRAELRRQKRMEAKNDAVFTVTREQLRKMVADGVSRGLNAEFERRLAMETDKCFVVMMTLPCVALHDTFGFGNDRLLRFMENVLTKYDCTVDDFDHKRKEGYDFDTFIRLLREETGFDVAQLLVDRGVIRKKQ